jgi:hypothetical protein
MLSSAPAKTAVGGALALHVPAALQVWPEPHVPQLFTVRDVPQLSFAVRLPQVWASRWQKAALVSAVHVPPPPPPPLPGAKTTSTP